MHTACVWSEKLPFAGYSVVKDHSGESVPSESLTGDPRGVLPPDPLGSLHSLRQPASLRSARPKPSSQHRPAAAAFIAELGQSGPSEAAKPQWLRSKQSGEYRARTG